MRRTETTLQNQSVAIKNLETYMGQMTLAISSRALGALPSNTETNPKDGHKYLRE